MTATARTSSTATSSARHRSKRLVALLGAVTSVAALTATTAAPASASTTETSAATSATSDCNRDLGSQALTFSKRSWPVTGRLHMDTYSGTIGRTNGSVAATTRIYNSYWGQGYTGSTMVILYNSCNEVIGVTPPLKWGVDAKAWFWNSNERIEPHLQTLPTDITRATARVEVVHSRVTGTDYKKYNIMRDAACQIWPIVGGPIPCPLPKL